MTQHPSLKSSGIGGKFRSVLKRFEKIKELAEKEKWEEEKDSVYKLPKIKRIKFKIKKVKAAEGEAAAAAEGAAAAPSEGAQASAAAGKAAPAAGKKEAAKEKPQGKK